MFTQLSMYSQTLVESLRVRMNKFIIAVSSLVEEDCRTIILIMTWIFQGS